jgi:hypothetical protein
VNPGTRVHTPAGDGTVLHIKVIDEWTFQKPYRRAWIRVQVDERGAQWFAAADVTEIEAEIPWPE